MKFMSRSIFLLFFTQWMIIPLILGLVGYLFVGPNIGNSTPLKTEEIPSQRPSEPALSQPVASAISEHTKGNQSKPTIEPEVEISVDLSDNISNGTSHLEQSSSFEKTFPKEKAKQNIKSKKSSSVLANNQKKTETKEKNSKPAEEHQTNDAEPPAISLPESNLTSEI